MYPAAFTTGPSGEADRQRRSAQPERHGRPVQQLWRLGRHLLGRRARCAAPLPITFDASLQPTAPNAAPRRHGPREHRPRRLLRWLRAVVGRPSFAAPAFLGRLAPAQLDHRPARDNGRTADRSMASDESESLTRPSGSRAETARDDPQRPRGPSERERPPRAWPSSSSRRAARPAGAGPGTTTARACETPNAAATTSRLLATLAKSRSRSAVSTVPWTVMDRAPLGEAASRTTALIASRQPARADPLPRRPVRRAPRTAFGRGTWPSPTGLDAAAAPQPGRPVRRDGRSRPGPSRPRPRAATPRRGHRRRRLERIALHNLGCLEFTAGDLPQALRLMHEGIELDRTPSKGSPTWTAPGCCWPPACPTRPTTRLAEAAELFRRDRCWQDLGEVDLTRAEVALLTGRATDARRLAARARDRFRRHGNDRWRRAAELVLLQADLAAGRPAARLLPHAHRLADEFAEAGSRRSPDPATLLAGRARAGAGTEPAEADALARAGRVRRQPTRSRSGCTVTSCGPRSWSGARKRPAGAAQVLRRGLRGPGRVPGAVRWHRPAERQRRPRPPAGAARSRPGAALGRPGSVIAAVERSPGGLRPRSARSPRRRTREPRSCWRSSVDVGRGPPQPPAGRSPSCRSELRSRSWLSSGSRAWHPPASVAELRAAAARGRLPPGHGHRVARPTECCDHPAGGSPKLVELGGWRHRPGLAAPAVRRSGSAGQRRAAGRRCAWQPPGRCDGVPRS